MVTKYRKDDLYSRNNLLKKFTIPSIAVYIFQQIYLQDGLQSDLAYCEIFRENYTGGCTQVWKHVAE